MYITLKQNLLIYFIMATDLGHDVLIDVQFRLRPVDGEGLPPGLHVGGDEVPTGHSRRAVTLVLHEREASVLRLVARVGVHDDVDDILRESVQFDGDFRLLFVARQTANEQPTVVHRRAHTDVAILAYLLCSCITNLLINYSQGRFGRVFI